MHWVNVFQAPCSGSVRPCSHKLVRIKYNQQASESAEVNWSIIEVNGEKTELQREWQKTRRLEHFKMNVLMFMMNATVQSWYRKMMKSSRKRDFSSDFVVEWVEIEEFFMKFWNKLLKLVCWELKLVAGLLKTQL